jgi:hypothetical protein
LVQRDVGVRNIAAKEVLSRSRGQRDCAGAGDGEVGGGGGVPSSCSCSNPCSRTYGNGSSVRVSR